MRQTGGTGMAQQRKAEISARGRLGIEDSYVHIDASKVERAVKNLVSAAKRIQLTDDERSLGHALAHHNVAGVELACATEKLARALKELAWEYRRGI